MNATERHTFCNWIRKLETEPKRTKVVQTEIVQKEQPLEMNLTKFLKEKGLKP